MHAPLACAVAVALCTTFASATELARGMRGHGLSVFEGDRPERFEVEILGVLHRSASTGDNILARLSGAGLEHSGVLQGMSGSPVYVDGELIGAVMATWAFAKDPLCSIRPIAEMRSLSTSLDRGAHPGYRPGDGRVRAPALDTVATPVARWIDRDAPAPAGVEFSADVAWSANGLPAELLGEIGGSLGVAVQEGTSTSEPGSEGDLQPGDAMAVLLIDGDARLAAVGTVTERRGEQLLGFGHPMLGIGPVSLPLARARVIAGMPSSQLSFKISEIGDVVGAVAMDQRVGVLGVVGVEAETLPLQVVINDRHYDFRLGRVAAILPDLAAWCARAALLDQDAVGDDAFLRLTARARFEGHEDLVSHASVDGSLAGSMVGGELALVVSLALTQPDWARNLSGLQLSIEREPVAHRARIGRVLVRPEHPAPGDLLQVRVELLEDGGPPHWQELQLRIPPGQRRGPLSLHVSDGPSSFRDELQRAPARWLEPGAEAIRDALGRRLSANSLSAVLYAPSNNVVVGDRELGPLPPSMQSLLLQGSGRSAAAPVGAAAVDRAQIETPWLLRGQQVVSLAIEAPDSGARKESP